MKISGHDVSGGMLALAVGAPFILVYGEYLLKKREEKKLHRKRKRQAGFKTMKSTDRRARERAEQFDESHAHARDLEDT